MVNFSCIGKSMQSIFKTKMVSSTSRRMFSFAQKHKFRTSGGGGLNEDGLILVHVSSFAPKNGYIDTARSAIGAPRDSVHFAVNHAVTPHLLGADWTHSNYAILMPMRSALNTGKNKFVGGVAGDFYSKGKVKIPKDAVIVRKNSKVPKGKYKISDASKIEEFKELHGVKVIETSNPNMKKTVDNVIGRLGYQTRGTDVATIWGTKGTKSSVKYFSYFNNFIKGKGMIPAFHTYTPNGKTEILLQAVYARAIRGSDWVVNKNGKIIVDYRKEILNSIKYIEENSKKSGMPLDFDTSLLKEIIKNSKTPQDAVSKLNSEMGISKSMHTKEHLDMLKTLDNDMFELSCMSTLRMLVSGKSVRTADKLTGNYLSKPSLLNLKKINSDEVTDLQMAVSEEIQRLFEGIA